MSLNTKIGTLEADINRLLLKDFENIQILIWLFFLNFAILEKYSTEISQLVIKSLFRILSLIG
ncbi:MAG: hypothetical protein MK076_06570 [Flavobacteriales bacterium]|nr:hypothetical protein [Flavobacteriales bacterium]